MGRKRLYTTPEESAQRHRDNAARRSREQNASVKEIGPLPDVVNPERKEFCRESLYDFMMTYGGTPDAESQYVFTTPFCEEQLYMIRTLEQVLKYGGEIPLCIFRGGCKTTFCEWGILWACAYGWQKFGVIVASNLGMARKIIANIKININLNPLLAEDFPEICYPIACLERVTQRAKCQTLEGKPTEISFTADMIQLPNIPGKASSQAIVMGVGADSSFRGLRVGKQRPTVVLIDDPQTNKSANSLTQTESRWENITSSMKGLAGPGVALAMVATITVIKKDDLAERILQQWNGKRFGILRSMPKNMAEWDKYNDEYQHIKLDVSDLLERSRLINQYYIDNRTILDEGAEAAWESNFTKNEVSAIQHAMNLYYFDRKAFWSEYMNEPVDEENDAENLTLEDLERKVSKTIKHGIAPVETQAITVGIDIQKDCLYWLATAWASDFSGTVIDYGRYPKGNAKMGNVYQGKGLEEQVSYCLTELASILHDKTYLRDVNREPLRIDKIIVDANWGFVSEVVKKVCRNFKGWLEPTFGWGKGPDQRFFAKKAAIGEERGLEWKKMPLEIRGLVRNYIYNTNWWKSFVRQRIKTDVAAKSTITFYSGNHSKLFTHLLGETSSKVTGQYGTMDKWTLRPGEPNHWFDCLIMSSVAASAMKIRIPNYQEGNAPISTQSKRRFIDL